MSNLAQIWVPTNFNKHTFSSSGVSDDRVHVVGEAVDTDQYDPSRAQALDIASLLPEDLKLRSALAKKPFIFLSVFNKSAAFTSFMILSSL